MKIAQQTCKQATKRSKGKGVLPKKRPKGIKNVISSFQFNDR